MWGKKLFPFLHCLFLSSKTKIDAKNFEQENYDKNVILQWNPIFLQIPHV